MRRLVAALVFACVLSAKAAHAADADVPPATAALKGIRFVLKPGFAYQKTNTMAQPPVTQDVSFAISNHFGWAFPLGPIVLSPGVSVPTYFFDAGSDSDPTMHLPGATVGVLGEIEVHVPLRYVSVYGLVGAGAGFYFGSGQQGGVFRGGGGVMLYLEKWIGLGAQATFLAMSNAAKGKDSGIQALEMTWPVELRF